MVNPFIVDTDEQRTDGELIQEALNGNRDSLTKLISCHQAWIYNIALRMVLAPADAEDITQEILIKVMTKLSTYDSSKASFRTWLYRIVVNHVINMNKKSYEMGITTLEKYYSFIDVTPDKHIEPSPETKLFIDDLAISCVLGSLLCMDRQQRLIFILGVIFNVSSEVGAEIMEISPDTFRKTLSRTRSKLHNFMTNKCGLINAEAPCKCRNKISEFIEKGWYTKDNIKYYKENASQVNELISLKIDHFNEAVYTDFMKQYRSHPFYEPSTLTTWIKETLEKPEFKSIFDLN